MPNEETEENDDTTVTVQSTSNLKGYIDDVAWAQLMGFVTNVGTKEASGFFLYQRDEFRIHIKRAFLIKGTASGAYTEMDQDAKAKFFMGLYRHGVLKPGSGWALGWFHFHTTFNPFWSSTDREQRAELSGTKELYPSLVMNNKGEYMLAIDMNIGGVSIGVDTIDLNLVTTGKKIHDRRDYKAECDRKISQIVYAPVVMTSGDMYHWSMGYGADDYPGMAWGGGTREEVKGDSLDRVIAMHNAGLTLRWWEEETYKDAWDAGLISVGQDGKARREGTVDDAEQGYLNLKGEVVAGGIDATDAY